MSLKLRRVLLGTGAALVVASGVMLWQPGTGFWQADAATDYQQLQKFSTVMEMVRRTYVKDLSDEKLIDGALSGMLSSLDPHSTYLDKEMYKQMTVETKGEFGGLGIEIASAEGGIRVVSPIEDTPADRAGVKAGDLIIKIDNELARDMSLSEGVKKMSQCATGNQNCSRRHQGQIGQERYAGTGLCLFTHYPVSGTHRKPAQKTAR